MLVAEAVRLLVRRWPVVVAGLLLTLSALLAVISRPVVYRVTSSVAILPSPFRDSVGVPPYTDLPAVRVAPLLSRVLGGESVADELSARGVAGGFTAFPAVDGSPVLVLSADAPVPEAARQRLLVVQDLIRARLEAWQAGVPDAERITLADLVPFDRPRPVRDQELRQVFAGVGLGGLGTVGAAALRESHVRRRRRHPGGPGDQGRWPAPADNPRPLAPTGA